MGERLQKYMARCGIASRRGCEEIIAQGRVSVNGEMIQEMGRRINPQFDDIRVDGKIISPESKSIYIILNKPAEYITSVSDPQGRPTVLDLVEDISERIYPVGRLDYDSEGLLMLTNDGELAYRLTHPKYEIKKQYNVIARGDPDIRAIKMLEGGVDIDGYLTKPANIVKLGMKGNSSIFQVTIHEGRNRQVRRMFETIGHPVIYLKREKFGNISLGSLELGRWRYLSTGEIEDLMDLVGRDT